MEAKAEVKYRRLSVLEREEIALGLALGLSVRELARRLGRSASTVSREIRRNVRGTEAYRAVLAQSRCQRRLGQRYVRRLKRCARLWGYVEWHLRRQWSPGQIAQMLKKDYPHDPAMQVSHEAIYTYLYVLPRGILRKTLLEALRQPRIHRHQRRAQSVGKRGSIPDMLSIERRPPEVADRSVPGHWEGDLIMGYNNRSAIGTLVERTTRATILVPLKAHDAQSVRQAFAEELRSIPQQMRVSLTYDQGKEMAQHKLFTQDTQMIVYFAHPRSPWERASNENTNGLVRQYFPKGMDLSTLSRERIKQVQSLINERPKGVLNWNTPYKLFHELLWKAQRGDNPLPVAMDC